MSASGPNPGNYNYYVSNTAVMEGTISVPISTVICLIRTSYSDWSTPGTTNSPPSNILMTSAEAPTSYGISLGTSYYIASSTIMFIIMGSNVHLYTYTTQAGDSGYQVYVSKIITSSKKIVDNQIQLSWDSIPSLTSQTQKTTYLSSYQTKYYFQYYSLAYKYYA